jgi:hypothetical protein
MPQQAFSASITVMPGTNPAALRTSDAVPKAC